MDTPTGMTNDESDEDILLTFYRLFHTFEQALRKTSFTRWVKRT